MQRRRSSDFFLGKNLKYIFVKLAAYPLWGEALKIFWVYVSYISKTGKQ